MPLADNNRKHNALHNPDRRDHRARQANRESLVQPDLPDSLALMLPFPVALAMAKRAWKVVAKLSVLRAQPDRRVRPAWAVQLDHQDRMVNLGNRALLERDLRFIPIMLIC